MARGGCCSYSKEGTVTIALLLLAADDPESKVWCLAVEETGYLLDDVLGFSLSHSVSEHLPGPECSTLQPLPTQSPGVHSHKESLQYRLCSCYMSIR